MNRQTFTIPFRLPSLNELIGANRTNPYAGAQLKKRTDRDIQSCLGGLRRVDGQCIVACLFVEPNRRRDVDNVESARKFILDALVAYGVLEGDSPKYVVGAPAHTTYGLKARVDVCIIDGSEDELNVMLNTAFGLIWEE